MSDIDDHTLDRLAPEVDVAASRALFDHRRARRRNRRRVAFAGAGLGVVAAVVIAVATLGSSDKQAEQIRTVDEPTIVSTVASIEQVRTIEDTGNGLSVRLQPGWALAPGPLTLTNFQRRGVSQADPAELLSFGTGPLYYGIDPTCEVANLPVETLDAMESDEVLVQVLERRLRGTPDLPLRPDHFDETTVPEWTNACADPPATMRRVWFRTGGDDPALEREIGVLVVIGDTADPDIVEQLWTTLDGLVVEPTANTRQVLEFDVPADMIPLGSNERSDAAIEAIPFDAYPWFQIDHWDGGAPGGGDRTMTLVIANEADEWLERSITPDLAGELAKDPEGVVHDSDEAGLVYWSDRDEPLRWIWWKPSDDTIALAIGYDVSESELEEVVASARWTSRRIEPDGFSWLPPYPVGCENPILGAVQHPESGGPDHADGMPPVTATVLEHGLMSAGDFMQIPNQYPPVAFEVVPRDGEVWLRRDGNGNVNAEHGPVETINESGVKIHAVGPVQVDEPPAMLDGVPVQQSSCRPAD